MILRPWYTILNLAVRFSIMSYLTSLCFSLFTAQPAKTQHISTPATTWGADNADTCRKNEYICWECTCKNIIYFYTFPRFITHPPQKGTTVAKQKNKLSRILNARYKVVVL